MKHINGHNEKCMGQTFFVIVTYKVALPDQVKTAALFGHTGFPLFKKKYDENLLLLLAKSIAHAPFCTHFSVLWCLHSVVASYLCSKSACDRLNCLPQYYRHET